MDAHAGGVTAGIARDVEIPRSLSPSGASTFRQCARRWKFRYIDKRPDPPGAPALRGTFVHHVLEELLAVAPAQRTLERARAICRDLWPALAGNADFEALELSADDERAFRWNAWRDIEGFFELVDPTGVDVVDRERDLVATLDGVPFRGIVDLVDRAPDGLRITDYKTGRPPGARYLDSRLTQVWLYAAAAAALGDDVSEVRLLYLGETGNGRDTREPIEIARPFDPDAVHAAVDEHRVTWDRIADAVGSGQFEPTTGPLCSWCPYQDDCPEGRAEHQRRNGLAA
ncbi:RecB family exonuclease [Candidatus Poriferisodalis sp.]|uniref:RecB family exonuclease n=1 Tax=Candidatus Poriferisodalis sp. TaxID=3101277 RepID=UPI003B025082